MTAVPARYAGQGSMCGFKAAQHCRALSLSLFGSNPGMRLARPRGVSCGKRSHACLLKRGAYIQPAGAYIQPTGACMQPVSRRLIPTVAAASGDSTVRKRGACTQPAGAYIQPVNRRLVPTVAAASDDSVTSRCDRTVSTFHQACG